MDLAGRESASGVSFCQQNQADWPSMAARTQRTTQAVGLWGCFFLGVGTVFIFASVGFLSFFWIDSKAATENAKPPSSLWTTIVLRGWATRAVTISSIFIRIAIGLQNGLMTAMLASIIIEKRGVRLHQLPALSIMRSVSSGAHNLLGPLVSGPGNLEQLCYGGLALLVVATSFASNFTSTLLLADFGNVHVTAAAKTETVPVGINSTHAMTGTDYWRSQPNRFPRFDELAGDPKSAPGVQDTGPSMRAFLPYSATADRETLKYFDGPGPVFNSQVVCLRPSLRNLTVSYSSRGSSTSMFIGGWYAGFDVPYIKKTPLPQSASSTAPWSRRTVKPTTIASSLCASYSLEQPRTIARLRTGPCCSSWMTTRIGSLGLSRNSTTRTMASGTRGRPGTRHRR